MTDQLISNGFELDLSQSIPVPISFAIADIKEPSKRKQSFSKEVTLPDTMNNNNFFRGMYGYSATENGVNFDATAKVPIILKKRGVQVMAGLLKLNKVAIVNGVPSFNCTVLSDSVDLFQLLTTINVAELDWSEYDHILSRTNIKNSFTAPIGSGYYYPLIERGNVRLGATVWRTTDLYPYVYLREALLKCFEYLGLTWDSDFLDTDMFKSILFGFGGGEIKTIPPVDLLNRKVEIDNGDFNYSTTIGPVYNSVFNFENQNINPFADNEFTSIETSDILGQFTDGDITVEYTGNYSLNLQMRIQNKFTYSLPFYVTNRILSPRIDVYKNGGTYFQIGSTLISETFTSYDYTEVVDFNINNTPLMALTAGDVLTFKIRWGGMQDLSGLVDFSVTSTLDSTTVIPIQIDFTSTDESITDGGIVRLGAYLPQMKCSDLLLSTIRQFNLYISEPSDYGVVSIEPLSPFYTATNDFTDISELVDHRKPIVIRPAANEYAKGISYIFKASTDFDATTYFNRWEENYGDLVYEQGSYYAKGEQKTELAWSTIIPFQISAGFMIPRFVKIENGIIKPNTGAARIMFRNGNKAGSWTLRDAVGTGSQLLTSYPCVHHFDDWQSPTIDLNFKLVNEVYYTATIVTSKNSFSEYYSTFINEMTSSAGKIVNLSVYWNELDIKNRNFGKLLMIDGSLFRLNLIKDFSADVQATTEIELVKVLKAKKRAGKQIVQGATTVIYVDNNIASPPNNTGEDTGVISAPINNPNFQTNLIIG